MLCSLQKPPRSTNYHQEVFWECYARKLLVVYADKIKTKVTHDVETYHGLKNFGGGFATHSYNIAERKIGRPFMIANGTQIYLFLLLLVPSFIGS